LINKQVVTVLGAGSWGTALSMILADNGHDVRLWSHNDAQSKEINETHTNQKYLPGITLSTEIKGFSNLRFALDDTNLIVLAVPTKAIREVVSNMKSFIPEGSHIVHVSKGIEPDTLLRISEMIVDELGEKFLNLSVLSGPSHAEEVSKFHPTTVAVSSNCLESAEFVQDVFMHPRFRVYTNSDLVGVEIGGALKNIIALGAGISDGLNYGDNAKAALITRGLAEIARLGTKMGASPLTFSGLTGIGDLIVTCTSVHSRNWRAGNMLGKGKPLDETLASMGMVVEGVRTTKAAYQLSKKYQIEMPITLALHSILFEDVSPKEAVDSLMARMKKNEMDDLVNLYENRFSE
jgi:glycerol-3-phosphate dehydrogenase (NAD(P)+)